MVSLDPPDHTRVRRHTARAFTPRRVAGMTETIRATVAQLLDEVDAGAPFDLVATLTFPLPATIVFSLIGVPPEDYARLKRWCGYRAGLTFGRPRPEEQVEHAENIVAYRGYLRGLVAERVERRADDLTSALIDIHDEDPEAFTLEEIASILFSLSFAGHETTNYLIGNLVRRLLEDPARWARVVADPAAIPGAVEETLRFDPSVCVWRRVTTKPATVGGVELPAGAKLFLWLAAAGRDASVFPEPDAFDLDRDNARRHLAFGRGIHFCLGSSLGKLEAELALAELGAPVPPAGAGGGPGAELSPEHLVPRPAGVVGGGWLVAVRSALWCCLRLLHRRGGADPGRRDRWRSSSARTAWDQARFPNPIPGSSGTSPAVLRAPADGLTAPAAPPPTPRAAPASASARALRRSPRRA